MKYLPIRDGFSIKKDEIEAVEDVSGNKLNFNGLSSNVHMKNGRIFNTNIPYANLLSMLEAVDTIKVDNTNKFTQHNAG